MNSNIFWELNEAYQLGVCNRVDEQVLTEDELVDIQEWVEALIEEGYDLDEYTDEELYEAYLDEVKGGGKVDPHNPDPSRGMKHSPYVKAGIKQVGIENQTIRRENEIRRKHKAPRVDPWEDPSDPDYREPPLRVVQATNRANRAAATDPKMGRLNKRYQKIGDVMDNMKEELDLYDIISEYLVSEGFCESYEDADVIMANMSEEWRQSILDEEDKKLLAARKKSIARLNAAKNIEDKQADSDYENSIDHSNPSKGKSGYMEVPTDYRARKRRASGR